MPPGVHTPEEDRGWFAARLADGEHEAWVAERGDRILGYALATETWLDHLYVEPDHQAEGVGGALLDVVKARASGRVLPLGVRDQHCPRAAFYARRGLVELERTDGSGNEEKAPDVKMAWPGGDPLAFYRGLIDDVDAPLGDLLARRLALTRAVQDHKRDPRPRPRPGARDRRGDGRGPRPSSAPTGSAGSCTDHQREPRGRSASRCSQGQVLSATAVLTARFPRAQRPWLHRARPACSSPTARPAAAVADWRRDVVVCEVEVLALAAPASGRCYEAGFV